MKRIFVVMMAAFAAFAVTGLTSASADDVSTEAAPSPASPIVWTGNGTDGGLCNQVFDDPSVPDGSQVWLFILTSPSSDTWALDASFDDGTVVTGQAPSKVVGSIHFEVTTDIGAKLLSASATNGKTNSILTVSHCTVGAKVPPLEGSLSVTKTVVSLPAGVTGVTLPTSYTAHVSCDDGTEVDVTLPAEGGAGDPALITGIDDGSICTVVETSALPANTAVTYDPAGANTEGVEVTVEGGTVEVNITNDFTAVQGEVVVKPVTPAPAAQAVTVAPAFTG
jgi:hypothetical protein